MSSAERIQIANQIVSELRKLSYDECRAIINDVLNRIVQREGKEFQVEIQALWDDKERRNVRVLVGVSEPGISDFFPTGADFIIAPDGSFIGDGIGDGWNAKMPKS